MKFLFDLFPVLLFFVSFRLAEWRVDLAQKLAVDTLGGIVSGGVIAADLAPILLATAIAMVASVLQIGYLLLRRRRVDPMLWMSFIIIMVFGGLTIYFHNPDFIKWKPTVLYWCLAGCLLFGQLFFKKNLIRQAMEAQIKLPDSVWTKLGLAWTAYFAIMGIVNLYVAYNYPNATWVNFKLLVVVAITPIFVIVQSIVLAKYMQEPA